MIFRSPAPDEAERLLRDYERDGVARVPALLADADRKRVADALARYRREIVPGLPPGDVVYEADGATIRNLWRMQEHDRFFQELADDLALRTLVAPLVRGEPGPGIVELFQKPAKIGSAVPPHQDNAYFCQSPPDMLTVWIALDPATEANGPVTYRRGSHRRLLAHRPSRVSGNSMGLAKPPPRDSTQEYVGRLDAGDALIHHCQTVHWSAPNVSDQPRAGLLVVYRGSHTRTDPALHAAYLQARP